MSHSTAAAPVPTCSQVVKWCSINAQHRHVGKRFCTLFGILYSSQG